MLRVGRTRAIEKNFPGNWELGLSVEILVPYLNNPSKEAIFGSNNIKEQHETMKLQNEYLCSEVLKT